MAQIAKTLFFFCVLIGWSKAFPHHDVISEDEVMKDVERVERERRDVERSVTDLTPPVCRVINESLDCPYPCGNATWEVTYIMTDGNGSGIDHPSFSAHIPDSGNDTFYIYINSTLDENGFNATWVKYACSCCITDVHISVVDNAGNKAECPLNIKRPVTTIEPLTVRPTSSSSTTAISLWSGLIVTTLKSMLL